MSVQLGGAAWLGIQGRAPAQVAGMQVGVGSGQTCRGMVMVVGALRSRGGGVPARVPRSTQTNLLASPRDEHVHPSKWQC